MTIMMLKRTCQHDVVRITAGPFAKPYDRYCAPTSPILTSIMPSTADDPITQAEHEHYHSPVYAAAGAGIMRWALVPVSRGPS